MNLFEHYVINTCLWKMVWFFQLICTFSWYVFLFSSTFNHTKEIFFEFIIKKLPCSLAKTEMSTVIFKTNLIPFNYQFNSNTFIRYIFMYFWTTFIDPIPFLDMKKKKMMLICVRHLQFNVLTKNVSSVFFFKFKN